MTVPVVQPLTVDENGEVHTGAAEIINASTGAVIVSSVGIRLAAPWQIAENGRLPISYDAVVSAVSQPVTEQDVLSIVFLLEWQE